MTKRINKITLTILVLTGLSGCLETNIKKADTGVNASYSFKILIPDRSKNKYKAFSSPSEAINAIQGVNHFYRERGSLPDISALSFKASNSTFEVLRYKCLSSDRRNVDEVELGESAYCNQFSKQVIKLSGSLEMKKLPNSRLIVLIPRDKQQASNHNYNLSLSANDLRKRFLESHFPIQFDVDSKYSTDSTYANFARILRKNSYNNGKKDPVTGKIYRDGFLVNVSGKSISIRVETFPYRNGSKAVVYALIPPQNNGNLVDFYKVSEELKTKIKRLVNL